MGMIQPPPQYDIPPKVPVIERIISWDEVQKLCAARAGRVMVPGQFIYGCSHYEPGKVCYIWYTGDAATLRHERAHCAGWPPNHPGGF